MAMLKMALITHNIIVQDFSHAAAPDVHKTDTSSFSC